MDSRSNHDMRREIIHYMGKTNHYDILGINRNASNQQIKQSYKKLALKFHPDKNQTPGSKQVFSKINHAYSSLITKTPLKHNQQNHQNRKHQEPDFQKYRSQYDARKKQFEKERAQYERQKARQQQQQNRKAYQSRQQQNKTNTNQQPQNNNKKKQQQKKTYSNRHTNHQSDSRSYQSSAKSSFGQNSTQGTFYQKWKRNHNKWTYIHIQEQWGSFKARFEQKQQKENSVPNDNKEAETKLKQEKNNKQQPGTKSHSYNPYYQPKSYLKRNLLGLIGMLILVAIFVNLGPSSSLSKPYQMRQGSGFSQQFKTKNLQINYYVKPQFFSNKNSLLLKESIENNINEQYLKRLSKECEKSLKHKKNIQRKAYSLQVGKKRLALFKTASKVDMSSCNRLHEIQQKFPGFIEELFY